MGIAVILGIVLIIIGFSNMGNHQKRTILLGWLMVIIGAGLLTGIANSFR